MLATEYAIYYGIAPQSENETDLAFRSRVSGILRDHGQIIEAHEVYSDKRYDAEDGADVMTGIMGAVAQAMQDKHYGSHGARQIGDDFAAGMLVQNPEPKLDPMAAMMAMLLFG